MFIKFLAKIFGNRNDRILKKFNRIVYAVNELESIFEKWTDKKLKKNTELFRHRLKNGESLDNLLPESFATIREASKRIFKMRHFDVQILGGIVLHKNCIAEMRTGEGKTLTSTLPSYLNALTGEGVHIVTMNDYLAERDAKKNALLFEFLGLKVGLNLPDMSFSEKKYAYSCDITYGTNNEYGFDYLRDNMISSPEERVQRKLHYALIDEVDSILIDEARTPLIISGPSEDSSDLYKEINKIVPSLMYQKQEDSDFFNGKGDYYVDQKSRQIYLTERGLIKIEKIFISKKFIKKGESLYSSNNIVLMHHIISALRAHKLFIRDVDYLIKNDNIIIVDEHTGRTVPGRRWSDGLHQAIEAKENVTIKSENQTLASITFQNYFRLYKKISGMTGTAVTESFEFRSIYNLDTIAVPTNKPMIRNDFPDAVYMTEKEKINAILKDIQNCVKNNRPVLVGTISIEKSEIISQKLKKLNIKHHVLNAKFHAQEAKIIAQAGKSKSVTIATNMAGRGTDIVLGGNLDFKIYENMSLNDIQKIKIKWKNEHDLVVSSGGLHVIGTERHESRRIDNQLRGRSGRQGDTGSSRFYLSMEDSLMRIFMSDKTINMMRKLGLNLNEAIEHPWVTKAIENAQKKVENRNFEIRKQLLEYDDVYNEQRRVIYSQRNKLIDSQNIKKIICDFFKDVFTKIVQIYVSKEISRNRWNIIDLEKKLNIEFNLSIFIKDWLDVDPNLTDEYIIQKVVSIAQKNYFQKENLIGCENLRIIEKSVMLKNLDLLWKEHLCAMDYLRQGIHLRGYAQKDPKQEYKRESFNLFSEMLESLKYEVVLFLSKLDVLNLKKYIDLNNRSLIIENGNKIGRNTLCNCGSGKKYKYCHGTI
ncbi:preprotein translocase subunit SecA [Buchnera aphidicola (Melanaphis sacchari)]|uniref:Protein translocase subunit SecA n=1 Tax=Buchnera aphidicola (Melanaphis sacchari) TaxID=2173854 RepID=A0A2U8DFI6_9GAMM|nr:preprotein translocase subunit SecA [Buchnera aphidicola]AWH90569.1 preprotein translocase subunit SecA [Buchnera aphidicola (Melanaphis sacchari)]